MEINEITGLVIGAAVAVHRKLGPGLLETPYQTCLAIEMKNREIAFDREHSRWAS